MTKKSQESIHPASAGTADRPDAEQTDAAMAADADRDSNPGLQNGDESDWRQQLADAETRALRYQADLDNFRRRARRETEEQLKYANLPLISELLESYDNLLRALDTAPAVEGTEDVLAGVRMVAHQIHDVLLKYGCHPIQSAGADFDPNFHQAVQIVDDETQPEGRIVHELRPGYRLHDRVIRPAQVVVVQRRG